VKVLRVSIFVFVVVFLEAGAIRLCIELVCSDIIGWLWSFPISQLPGKVRDVCLVCIVFNLQEVANPSSLSIQSDFFQNSYVNV
jgi:hypothetical protein